MKFIIEFEDKPIVKNDGRILYAAKGFNALLFDRNGLLKLKPYKEEEYIKVGDIVRHKVDKNCHIVVTNVKEATNVQEAMISGINDKGTYSYRPMSQWEKVGSTSLKDVFDDIHRTEDE